MKITRVLKHKRYVGDYLLNLRLDILNITIAASKSGGLSNTCVDRINHNAYLIRKYERRKKLLNY